MSKNDNTGLYIGLALLALLGVAFAASASNTDNTNNNTMPPTPPNLPDGVTPLAFLEYYPGTDAADFQAKVQSIAQALGVDPNRLMFVMWNESAKTFRPNIAGGGDGMGGHYMGLIQIGGTALADMNSTYHESITTDQLAAMTAVQQLDYVQQYLGMWFNRLGTPQNIYDLYLAVLYPDGMYKPDTYTFPTWMTNANPEFFKGRGNTKADFIAGLNAIVPDKYKSILGLVA